MEAIGLKTGIDVGTVIGFGTGIGFGNRVGGGSGKHDVLPRQASFLLGNDDVVSDG